jgi:hypothetical protein
MRTRIRYGKAEESLLYFHTRTYSRVQVTEEEKVYTHRCCCVA